MSVTPERPSGSGSVRCAPLLLLATLAACGGTPPAEEAPAPVAAAASGEGAGSVPGAEGVAAPVAPAEGSAPAAPERAPLASELRTPGDHAALLSRDALLAFGAGAARRARLLLDGEEVLPEERADALLALGAGGSAAVRPLLESSARVGEPEVRQAAILGLGELGAEGARALLTLDDEGLEPELLPALLAALRRAGTPAARERLAALAQSAPAPELAAQAERLLAAPPSTWPDDPAANAYLELRFSSARRFGFVAGRRWRDLVVAELFDDPDFVQAVVLESARTLRSPALVDHVLALTREEGSLARLAVAVEVAPEELARQVDAGEWLPRDPREWSAVLDAVRARHLEGRALPLILRALDVPELAPQARLLALRAGEPVEDAWISLVLASAPGPQRWALLDALGEGRHATWSPDLWAYVGGGDPDLDAAALVALARMPDEAAKNLLRDRLFGGRTEQRPPLVRALARSAHDPEMRGFLLHALKDTSLEFEVRLEVELGLAREGRVGDHEVLRAMSTPTSPARVRHIVLRALGVRADAQDLALIASYFPVEDEPRTSAILAGLLVQYREPEGMQLLRQALWTAEWNVSVLAGALLLQRGGAHVLLDELASPPSGAGERDLRRVGFALGEFGGPAAIELLSARRSGGDAALQGAYLGALTNRTR